jgi:methylmalonyl-CoA/ethylmalonyl-CoA epimerase
LIRRVDHISIAVSDLDQARAFFIHGLGGRELYSYPMKEQKYRWTTIELGSSCFIELIDPLEKESFVQRFLDKRGEGPHHITLQVDDLEEARRTLESRGIPYFGLGEPLPGWKELFIHPKDAFGTLIQLAEFNPLDWIEPGYIPPSYQEFAPASGPAEGDLEIRRVKTPDGPLVEIRQGDRTIRVSRARLANLIEALESISVKNPCRSVISVGSSD